MEMQSKRTRAFTLIELLVVISVIALLLSILVPVLRKAKDLARLVSCANNQHQLITGVTVYTVDNDGKFPPHPTYVARPNLLLRTVGSDTWENCAYQTLGRYLPEVNVYNCPLASFDDVKIVTSSGDVLTYQDLYEVRSAADVWRSDVPCSYMLFWNYGGFANSTVADMNADNRYGRYFLGPGKSSRNGLLVADSFYFSYQLGGGEGLDNRWVCNHPFKGGQKNRGNTAFPYYMGPPATEDLQAYRQVKRIDLNAGYKDGRVERFVSADTIRQQAVTGWAALYIPEIWK